MSISMKAMLNPVCSGNSQTLKSDEGKRNKLVKEIAVTFGQVFLFLCCVHC